MNALRNYFLPEFLNRISSIVIFNRLTRREIRKIVDLRLQEIQKRLESNDKKILIDCSEDVKDYLGAAGYSPAYGARPLQRLLEKEILNRLAVLLLRGSIKDGEVARVRLEDGKVVVVPNHKDSDLEDEDDMMDEDDALYELEETNGKADPGAMDLYE